MARPNGLAVLDCDGTLVDSLGAIVAAMDHACGVHGLERVAPEVVRGGIGLPLIEAVARCLPAVDCALHERVAASFRAAFVELALESTLHEPLFDGMETALDALAAAGFALGVATGKPRRGLLATLERHGLLARFTVLKGAEDGPGKPHPGMLLAAIAEAGADPRRTVMIGDTTYDMAMARAAGARALGVAWGYHAPAMLVAEGAERIVAAPAELAAASLALAGGRVLGEHT